MPESTIPSVGDIRAGIDFDSEYVVHVREGDVWTRP